MSLRRARALTASRSALTGINLPNVVTCSIPSQFQPHYNDRTSGYQQQNLHYFTHINSIALVKCPIEGMLDDYELGERNTLVIANMLAGNPNDLWPTLVPVRW